MKATTAACRDETGSDDSDEAARLQIKRLSATSSSSHLHGERREPCWSREALLVEQRLLSLLFLHSQLLLARLRLVPCRRWRWQEVYTESCAKEDELEDEQGILVSLHIHNTQQFDACARAREHTHTHQACTQPRRASGESPESREGGGEQNRRSGKGEGEERRRRRRI